MLWSAQLGINCPPTNVLTAFAVNLNGNAVTLSRALWDAGVRDDDALRTIARERRRQPLTFGVVFPFSSHHLLLRDWLRGAGLDPDRDVRIVVVPPAQMFRNLSAGTIDGFCAGEPWNTLAVREGIGWGRTCSAVHQPGHVEKVLFVTKAFATTRPKEHAGLVTALAQACAWCDEPQNREPLADLLSSGRYLNTPARVIASALLGRFERHRDVIDSVPDYHVFHRGNANVPTLAKAEAVQAALEAEGLLTPDTASPNLPRQLFREDLYREILNSNPLHEFAASTIVRGNTSA